MPKEVVSGLMVISRMAGLMAHWREAMSKYKIPMLHHRMTSCVTNLEL